MMKKIAASMLFSCIIVLLFTSCSLGGSMFNRAFGNKGSLGKTSHGDQAYANAQMDKVLEAIKNRDSDALKSMFSKKALGQEELDQSIIDLFDFFQGDFISYDDWSAINVEEGLNDDGTGRRWKALYSTYDVETNKQKYRIAIQDFILDTADSNNVGISSFYIIKFENDTDPNIAYRGDDKYTPGINFNIKNVLL